MKSPGAERGTAPFVDHLKYQDAELVLAGTSGKLTMLAESGSGTLAGGAHSDTFDELAEAEAMEISEVFQRDFDRLLLQRAFPGQPVLAYWELAAEPEQDVTAFVDHVVKLKGAGYRIEVEQIREKTGYQVEDPEEPLPATGPEQDPALEMDPEEEAIQQAVANRVAALFPQLGALAANSPAAPAVQPVQPVQPEQILQSVAASLAPVRDRIARILEIEDPEIQRERITALLAELPALLRDLVQDPAGAELIQRQLTASLLAGMRQG
jgi:phage gp29-like protein